MATPEIAKRTLSQTTRRGIRLIAHLSMSRRFCTNDRHMRNKRLHHSMYADTMKASVPSTSKDMYALSPSRSKDFYVSLLTSSGQRRSR